MNRTEKIKLFVIVFFSAANICFAQSDQTESITISTYYPSPVGVYKTLRLIPSNQPPAGSAVTLEGTMYFNDSEQKLYFYNDSGWHPFGSSGSGGGGQPLIIDSGHKVWPDWCNGTLESRTIAGGYGTAHLCSTYWAKNITFNKVFSKPPQVFVNAEVLSGSLDDNMGDYYTCAEHSTDQLVAFANASLVTNTAFVLRIGSSAGRGSGCCSDDDCPNPIDVPVTEYYGKGEASWVAIGY